MASNKLTLACCAAACFRRFLSRLLLLLPLPLALGQLLTYGDPTRPSDSDDVLSVDVDVDSDRSAAAAASVAAGHAAVAPSPLETLPGAPTGNRGSAGGCAACFTTSPSLPSLSLNTRWLATLATSALMEMPCTFTAVDVGGGATAMRTGVDIFNGVLGLIAAELEHATCRAMMSSEGFIASNIGTAIHASIAAYWICPGLNGLASQFDICK